MRTVHPLTPLSAGEIAQAVTILRESGHVTPTTRFVMVTLREPDKASLLAGEAMPREAFAILLDNATAQTYEAAVDLGLGLVTGWVHRPGVQPPVMLDEFFECEEELRKDPRFQDAMRRRGITDFGLLMIDPWSAGSYHSDDPAHAGRRLVRALTWVRGGEGENGYAHPVEGVLALFDLNEMKLVHLEDTGVVPLPPEPGNYAPRFLDRLRCGTKPLEIAQPEGPGFVVDDHRVEWQGWSFRVGFTPREGLVLHQVAYDDDGRVRPIFHRASMVDMIVPYGDPHPNHCDPALSLKCPYRVRFGLMHREPDQTHKV